MIRLYIITHTGNYESAFGTGKDGCEDLPLPFHVPSGIMQSAGTGAGEGE